MRRYVITALICLGALLISDASATNRKLVLITGAVGSHPEHQHEFYDGAMYWMTNPVGLNAISGLTTILVTNGWPTNVSVFDDADAIVLYSDGAHTHPWLGTEGYLGAQNEVSGNYSNRFYVIQLAMNRGVSVGLVHYAVDPISESKGGNQFLEWLGGHYGRDTVTSYNPMWNPTFTSIATHPITVGISQYSIYDEWYYNMRFRSTPPYHTPILQAQISPGMALEYSQQTFCWAYTRQNGGRGFGFTGGHFDDCWWNNSNQFLVVRNSIKWISKVGEVDSNTVIVNAGSTWKFNDQGTNMSSTWKDASFNDNAWASGKASLGYDSTTENPTPEVEIFKDPIVSPVSYGADANNKRRACYFRKSFVLSDTNAVGGLLAKINADDGFVAYLNGTEIGRYLMPTGAVTFQTLATNVDTATGNTWSSNTWKETLWTSVNGAASLLVLGTNVLAIEVHQAATNSTDLRFDAEITMLGFGALPPSGFTAYNDVAWGAGQPNGNITTLGFGSSGALVAYTNGAALDVQASLAEPTAVYWNLGQAGAAPSGTPAAQLFPSNIVDSTYHYYFNATSPTGTIDFTGLVPTSQYTFAFYCNRGGDITYADRYTTLLIQGADAFQNNSTTGAASQSATSATIFTGQPHGEVFRFDNVNPGSDGAVSFLLTGFKPCLNTFLVQTATSNAAATNPAPSAGWIAYDDTAWTDANTFGTNADTMAVGYATNGPLGRLSAPLLSTNGQSLTPVVTFVTNAASGIDLLNREMTLPPGTPVTQIFGGQIGTNNAAHWSKGTITMTLSGMDTGKEYSVVLWSSRGATSPQYSNRWTDIVISSADTFANNSSAGNAIYTTSTANDSTRVVAVIDQGRVARYDSIRSGPDGTVVFSLTANGLAGTTETNGYLNAFMVKESAVSGNTNTIPDSWKITHFGSTNAPNGGTFDDYDNDGLSNFGEWRAGTSPTNASSTLAVSELMPPTNNLVVMRWPGVTGITYTVQQSTNLLNGWTTLQSGISGVMPLNVYTVSVSTVRRYLRIQVE